MSIMRRRKFITQNETRVKETNNNLLQTRPHDVYNEQNKLTFSESENNYILSRIKNKSFVSVPRINKSTSTIDENDIIKKPSNEESHSSNKTTIESPRAKKRCESNKARQHVEKSFIHKIKVRNPKHRMNTLESSSNYGKSAGTSTGRSRDEIEDNSSANTINFDKSVKERIPRSPCKAMCRICHGGDSISEFGQLVSACSCRGTIGRVHIVCLETWLTESGKSRCELCSTSYAIRRIHKYGILRALTIWIVSQNSKQVMPFNTLLFLCSTWREGWSLICLLVVDMLGTILMMPLAILAAWLSGTTLLNLMAQDDEMAAWPLASSFILSCTTLVCYYCWIVSAATRHAIGWWIWYQSQYEVKLQLHTDPQADDDHNIPGND